MIGSLIFSGIGLLLTNPIRRALAGKPKSRRAAARRRLLTRATAAAKRNKRAGGKPAAFWGSLDAQVRAGKAGIRSKRISAAVQRGIRRGRRNPGATAVDIRRLELLQRELAVAEGARKHADLSGTPAQRRAAREEAVRARALYRRFWSAAEKANPKRKQTLAGFSAEVVSALAWQGHTPRIPKTAMPMVRSAFAQGGDPGMVAEDIAAGKRKTYHTNPPRDPRYVGVYDLPVYPLKHKSFADGDTAAVESQYKAGTYEVWVYGTVDPRKGDSWNYVDGKMTKAKAISEAQRLAKI
jgi:hypothetical protein